MNEAESCSRCGLGALLEGEQAIQLQKCAICFGLFCRDCSVAVSGRVFCSQPCAEYFFHGDEEDVEED
jgi:hypothetical protein